MAEMSYDSYFTDVQNELHGMVRDQKEAKFGFWILVPVLFITHAVVLAAVVWVVGWLFGTTTIVIGVTCAAYIAAVIGWSVARVAQRVSKMALHATSVHDEVLLVKELIHEEQRGSVQWP